MWICGGNKLKKTVTVIILLFLLAGILFLSTTVEYSLYRMLNFRLFNELAIENPYISTKCFANLGIFDNLLPEEQAMFNLLFSIPEARKQQTCTEFIKSDYSMTDYLISSIYSSANNNFYRNLYLIQFIITHNTSITENTYGYSYRCKDSDAGEKVCEISNNDDSIEELYFKRVGFRWLLMKIEQKTL